MKLLRFYWALAKLSVAFVLLIVVPDLYWELGFARAFITGLLGLWALSSALATMARSI